jgi:hypothetical protein
MTNVGRSLSALAVGHQDARRAPSASFPGERLRRLRGPRRGPKRGSSEPQSQFGGS